MIACLGIFLALVGSSDSIQASVPMGFQLGGGFSLEQTPLPSAWLDLQAQFGVGPGLLRYTLGLPMAWEGGGDLTMADGQQQPELTAWRQSLAVGFDNSGERFHAGLGAGMAWTKLDTFVVTPSKKTIYVRQSDGTIGQEQHSFGDMSDLGEAWVQTTTVESFDPFGYVECGLRLQHIDLNARLAVSPLGAGLGSSIRYVFPTF